MDLPTSAVFLQNWQEKTLLICKTALGGGGREGKGAISQFCPCTFCLPYLNLLEEKVFTKVTSFSLTFLGGIMWWGWFSSCWNGLSEPQNRGTSGVAKSLDGLSLLLYAVTYSLVCAVLCAVICWLYCLKTSIEQESCGLLPCVWAKPAPEVIACAWGGDWRRWRVKLLENNWPRGRNTQQSERWRYRSDTGCFSGWGGSSPDPLTANSYSGDFLLWLLIFHKNTPTQSVGESSSTGRRKYLIF